MAKATNNNVRAMMLVTAGRASSTLRQSIADKPPETPIKTNAQSLDGLAGLIDALLADTADCGGSDCMGRSVDGVKMWVIRDRLDAAARRAGRYEAALRAIAQAVGDGRDELDMLVDWQDTAQALARRARAALADTAGAVESAGAHQP